MAAKRRKRTAKRDVGQEAQDALIRAAKLAATDPEAFQAECKRIAKNLGTTAREVEIAAKNSTVAKQQAANFIIQVAGHALLKKWGLIP